LEEQGYEVRQTIDPRLVMSSVSLVPPDLILLDVNMPQMDGYTLCQHLKSNVQTRDIPVIFVSALDEAWDKVKGFTVGGVDYITKPFKVVEVLARVKNQLKLRRLQKTLQEQNQDLRTTVEQLQQANQELQRLSALDPLTHVANRRRFDDYLQRSWNRAVQKSEPLALVLFDIDYFKRYNDTYGHPKGDACLYLVAQVLKRASPRAQDLACRYGGEEFALILPDTNLQGAKTIAEQGLARVQALKIEHRQSAVSSHVTLSGGVVSVVPTPTEQLQRFMTLCDRALYRAKAQGRNRIVTLTYAVGP
jgi:diguanylate cyclase (GGDEF)-like protein